MSALIYRRGRDSSGVVVLRSKEKEKKDLAQELRDAAGDPEGMYDDEDDPDLRAAIAASLGQAPEEAEAAVAAPPGPGEWQVWDGRRSALFQRGRGRETSRR